MSEIFSILPISVRPYEWARREMEESFPNPNKFWVTKLNKMKVPPNVHISIFHNPGGKPDIWRVYWSDTDTVKYSILLNYDQLKKRHPEIVELLEANGVAAYEAQIERIDKLKEEYGKKYGKKLKVDYPALQPFKI